MTELVPWENLSMPGELDQSPQLTLDLDIVPAVPDAEHTQEILAERTRSMGERQVQWIVQKTHEHQQLRTGSKTGAYDAQRLRHGKPAVLLADAGERELRNGAMLALGNLIDPKTNLYVTQIIPRAAKAGMDPKRLWDLTVRTTLAVAHPHPRLLFPQARYPGSPQELHVPSTEERKRIEGVERDGTVMPAYPVIDLASRGESVGIHYAVPALREPLEQGATHQEVLAMWAAANTELGPVGLMKLPDRTVADFAALARAMQLGSASLAYVQVVEQIGKDVASHDWDRHKGPPVDTRAVAERMTEEAMRYVAVQLGERAKDDSRYSDADRLRMSDQRIVIEEHFDNSVVNYPIGSSAGLTKAKLEVLEQEPRVTFEERQAAEEREAAKEAKEAAARKKAGEKRDARQKGVDEGKKWPTLVMNAGKAKTSLVKTFTPKKPSEKKDLTPTLRSPIDPKDSKGAVKIVQDLVPKLLPDQEVVRDPEVDAPPPKEDIPKEKLTIYGRMAERVLDLGKEPDEPTPLQGPRNKDDPRTPAPARLDPGQILEATGNIFAISASSNHRQEQIARDAADNALAQQKDAQVRGHELVKEPEVLIIER